MNSTEYEHAPRRIATALSPEVAPAIESAELATTPRWLVHDSGRVAHVVELNAARCGEPGQGWRVVAGVAHCAVCEGLMDAEEDYRHRPAPEEGR